MVSFLENFFSYEKKLDEEYIEKWVGGDPASVPLWAWRKRFDEVTDRGMQIISPNVGHPIMGSRVTDRQGMASRHALAQERHSNRYPRNTQQG